VSNIVIAPAKTGRDKSSSMVVIKSDQIKRGRRLKGIPALRMFIIVVIKFIDPRMEEIPAKCSENMARSTDPPA
jgi:hypothetical protein